LRDHFDEVGRRSNLGDCHGLRPRNDNGAFL